MSTIDPETIDVTQPPPVSPTTAGLRSVVAAIKALFVTAKAEVEALQTAEAVLSGEVGGLTGQVEDLAGEISSLDGRVTALEEGGGGGGPTLTEEVIASPTNGQEVVVTHPAVPLSGSGSGKIGFSGLAMIPGSSQGYYPTTGWDDQNCNTGGASWIKDSGTAGHFSANPGPLVVQYALMYMADGWTRQITSIGVDPTVASSVVLDGEQDSGAITTIKTVRGSGSSCYAVNGVSYGGARMAYSITPELIDAAEFATLGSFDGIYSWHSGTESPTRAAITLNGGTTWLSFDGSDWVEIGLEDLITEGLQAFPAGSGAFSDSSGNAMDPAHWSALFSLAQAELAVSIKVAIGIDGGGVSYGGIDSFNFNTFKRGYMQPMNVSNYGTVGYSSIVRLSETETRFKLATGWGGGPTDWHCQVWTY